MMQLQSESHTVCSFVIGLMEDRDIFHHVLSLKNKWNSYT